MRLLFALSIALLVVLAATLMGQQRSDPPIPPDVRGVLLNSQLIGARGETAPLQATLPAGFPPELLPAGGTVEGAAESATVSTVVSRVPIMKARPWRDMLLRAQAAGWSTDVPPMIGFISTPVMPGLQLCRGENRASVSVTEGRTGQLVRSAVTRGAATQRPCRQASMRQFEDVLVPVLVPPTGAIADGAGSGGGLDEQHSTIRLQTSIPLRDIAKGYLQQMEDAGWQTVWQAPPDDSSAVARLTGETNDHAPVTAYVIVTKLRTTPPTAHAFLQVVRDRSRVPVRGGGPR